MSGGDSAGGGADPIGSGDPIGGGSPTGVGDPIGRGNFVPRSCLRGPGAHVHRLGHPSVRCSPLFAPCTGGLARAAVARLNAAVGAGAVAFVELQSGPSRLGATAGGATRYGESVTSAPIQESCCSCEAACVEIPHGGHPRMKAKHSRSQAEGARANSLVDTFIAILRKDNDDTHTHTHDDSHTGSIHTPRPMLSPSMAMSLSCMRPRRATLCCGNGCSREQYRRAC